MRKRLFLCLILCCMSIMYSFAQERTIKGKVTDPSTGEGLPGVSIIIKGTTQGTVTDIDGNYEILVTEGASLLFKSVGFTDQEMSVGTQSVMDLQMDSDVKQLGEIVVTAVGVEANKRDLGYSIQNVDANEIQNAGEANLVSALSGKAAGVNVISSSGTPGASAQIRIRGNKSIQGSNDPLFVVDGVPVDNSSFTTNDSPDGSKSNLGGGGVTNSNRMIDLNPDDIASMTILKGPAATALYGIRAANGAVIITTKRGKTGKPKINYSFGYTADVVNKLPDFQTTYGQGVGFEVGQAGTNSPVSWGPRISDTRYSTSITNRYNPNGFAIVSSTDATAGSEVPQARNNAKEFYETGNTFKHNLSVSGGSDKTTYYLSLGRLDQAGIIPGSDFARTSVKATISTDLTEKLKTTVSATYANSGGRRVQQGSNISGVSLGLFRTPPSFDNSAGYIFAEDNVQRSYRASGGQAVYDNPYWTINENYMTDNVDRMIGFTQLSYEFLPWLTVTYRLGLDRYTDTRKQRNQIGSSTLSAGQVINHIIRNRDLNSDFLVNINKDFGDLSIAATIGHNYFDHKTNLDRADGRGLASFGFFNLAAATSVITNEQIQKRKLAGVFGDVRISYKDQLFLNLTGRNDWSSTLSKDNNSFFYPAVSLGWAFTETLGLTDNPILPYAKLRASWGQVGNDAPIYSTKTLFQRSTVNDGWTTPNGVLFPAFGLNSFAPNGLLGNADLKAETTTTIEVGGDFKFFRNKLGMDITWYKAVTTDNILEVALPYASGWDRVLLNSGEIENTGLEIALNATPVKAGDFTWDVTLNFTRYKTLVKKMAEGLPFITIDPFGTQRIAEGEAFGIFYGTRFERDNQGRVIIQSEGPKRGLPKQDANQDIVGDPNPDWTAGLRNTFSWKGITVTALLDIRQGGDIYNGTKGVMNNFGVGGETLDRGETVVFEGVLEDGSVNDIAVVKGGSDAGGSSTNFYSNYGFTNLTELTIEDGSWIRLRELSVSYTFPKSLLAKVGFIQSASIALTTRNLFLITDYSGIDPETNLTGSATNVFGYDYFNNPNTKSYGVNLNVTF